MTSSSDELNIAFQTIFRGDLKPTGMAMLQSFITPLRVIVSCRAPTTPHLGLSAENFFYITMVTRFICEPYRKRSEIRNSRM